MIKNSLVQFWAVKKPTVYWITEECVKPNKGKKECTYKLPSSSSPMDNQVSHVSNQVSLQPKIKEHIEDIKYHLLWIYRMQITIARSCKGDYGPVHWGHIPIPQTDIMKVICDKPKPCPSWVTIMCSKKIEKATGTMNCKESNLQAQQKPDDHEKHQ